MIEEDLAGGHHPPILGYLDHSTRFRVFFSVSWSFGTPLSDPLKGPPA